MISFYVFLFQPSLNAVLLSYNCKPVTYFYLYIVFPLFSKEWEIVEKPQPDGTKKRYRRRIIIVNVVKKPEELVNENEVTIEEVPVDESNPEDPKYDPEVSVN